MDVKVIRSKGRAVLAEVIREDGVPERRILPEGIIDGTEVSERVFSRGILYGLPLAENISDFVLTGGDIERELHRSGIWTKSDLLANPQALQSAILAASYSVYARIVKYVKQSDNENGGF